VLVDGLTFGLGGTIPNVHPYLGVFNSAASSDVRFRNLGTRSSFASGGSASFPAYIYLSGGNNVDVKVQRCYLQPTRTGAVSTLNSDTNMLYESVMGDFADTMVIASLNSKMKGGAGTNTTTGQTSVYGTHFWDVFTADTTGRVVLSMNEPTAETSSLVTLSGNAKFTSAGGLSMPSVSDQAIIEMEYFAKGHTSFQNAAATLTGTLTGNMTYEYQIDKNDGNGWNGTWKTLNGANLSGETISASNGFKLKYRITTAVAGATNLISYIRIDTNSTLAAQTNNLYPLDVVPVSVTCMNESGNPVQNVRVRVEKESDGALLVEGYTNASGVFSTTYSGTLPVDAKVIARLKGYKFASLLATVEMDTGLGVPFTMITDGVVNLP
jgi:hypothetical protein